MWFSTELTQNHCLDEIKAFLLMVEIFGLDNNNHCLWFVERGILCVIKSTSSIHCQMGFINL